MQDWQDDIRDNEPKGIITYLVVVAAIIGTACIIRTSKGKKIFGKSSCEPKTKGSIYSGKKGETRSYSSGTTMKNPTNDKQNTSMEKPTPDHYSIQHDRGCNRLHDYLDYDWIIMTSIDGEIYEGCPIDVDYADESGSGQDELDIRTEKGTYIGLPEGKIRSIVIVR